MHIDRTPICSATLQIGGNPSYLRPTSSYLVGRRNALQRKSISASVLPSYLDPSRMHACARARSRAYARLLGRTR